MADNNTTRSGGIGFLGLLCIVFVVFKILGNITWSWWWVFSPIWLPTLLILAILLVIGIIAIIVALCER